MAQPQCFLNDYHGGKSIVLRSNPEDYFKPYSEYLVQVSGKWNPNLKDPTGQSKLGGWIFPKKNELQVRQVIQQICSGQISVQAPIQAPIQPQVQTQPFFQTKQPANTLQLLLSAAQARDMAQSQPQVQSQPQLQFSEGQSPVFTTPIISPVVNPPISENLNINQTSSVPPGYQQITYFAIKPEAGGTLQLTIGEHKIPVTVESVETQNNIVNKAIIQLSDGQRTMIQLSNDQWSIIGYQQVHSFSLY